LSFETGDGAGFPASWTFDFGGTLVAPLIGDQLVDDFSAWGADINEPTWVPAAVGVETFDVGWGAELLNPSFVLPTIGGGSVEDFEAWSPWDFVFSGTPAAVGVEPFDAWVSWQLAPVGFTDALFGEFPDPDIEVFEGFEEVKTARTITVEPEVPSVNPGNVVLTAHGLILQERIFFVNEDGRLPQGITSAPYFVQTVVSANLFRISPSADAGVPLTTILDHGLGTHKMIRDPDFWWTTDDVP
jgi:hypothetical protein